MAKKSSSNTLSSFWCPPAEIPSGKVGAPVSCIASTFEFDAAFFETELLPRFLGLKFDHTENELTFLVEREEQLATISAAVLVDIHKTDPGQSTLRWDQIPIAVAGSMAIQHSKIVLLVWENVARLIIGSANLTRPGYRRNREVFATLDFYDHSDSIPRSVIDDAVDLLRNILTWARVPDATRQRTQDDLSAVTDRISGWTSMATDFRPREKPKVRFVATRPAINEQVSLSSIQQAVDVWGPRRATEITVFTPFSGQPSGTEDKVVKQLVTIPQTRECIGWLVIPRRVTEESDSKIRVPLPQEFGTAWEKAFASRGGSRILALPRSVEGVDKINRNLHSKLLSIEDGVHHLMMIGSSNFTPHGMGVGVFNVEANLLFEMEGNQGWDSVELPLAWDQWHESSAVQWDEHYELPEDCVDGKSTLPGFFRHASYSQVTGVLNMTLNENSNEPSTWTVRLKGGEGNELKLFDPQSVRSDGALSYTFPEESRSARISALFVDWTDDAGDPRAARLVVSIESKADLAPSEQFKSLGVDAMLECLIRGQSLAEWHEKVLNRKLAGIRIPEALDSLRSVDTSSFLLYQVRRFGRALTGLCERLERVAMLPAALRYRFFKDPLGPMALGEALFVSAPGQKHQQATIASLSEHHRLFLLAELLLSVTNTSRKIWNNADGKARRLLIEVLGEGISTLVKQVSTCSDESSESLASNLREYINRVLSEAATLTGQLLLENADAR